MRSDEAARTALASLANRGRTSPSADTDVGRPDPVRATDPVCATDPDGARAAGTDPTDRRSDVAVVRRARDAVDDVEAAAEFVADGGPERLGAAIDSLADRREDLAAEGRAALRAFRAFERAAAGTTSGPDSAGI